MALGGEDIWRDNEGDPFEVTRLHESKVAHGGGPAPTPDLTNKGEEKTVYGRGTSWFNFPATEMNPTLIGKEGIRTYDKMRKSDAQVKAGLRMVKSPILTSHWHGDSLDDDPDHREMAEFLWWNLNNMHRPFISFLREALGFLDFGFYTFEIMWEIATWKPQPTEARPRPRERTVAKIMDLVPRHPSKVNEWVWDGDTLVGMKYGQADKFIPRDKLLLFTFDGEGDDPWGTSILRSAYQNWVYKEGLYRIDGVQKERHGVGVPRGTLPPGFTPEDKAAMIELLSNIRANEKAFILQLPNWEIDFVKPEGQMVNVLESAKHHGLMILETMLVQFLNLGSGESGSRAVGNTQSDAFETSVRYIVDFVGGTVNQDIVPQLIDYNYLTADSYPKLRARRLGDDARLRQLAVGLSLLTETGWVLPGPEDETWLRDYTDLPSPGQGQIDMAVKDRVRPLPQGIKESLGGGGGGLVP